MAEYAKRLLPGEQQFRWISLLNSGKCITKQEYRFYAYKPNALEPKSTDAEIEYALKAAKALERNLLP